MAPAVSVLTRDEGAPADPIAGVRAAAPRSVPQNSGATTISVERAALRIDRHEASIKPVHLRRRDIWACAPARCSSARAQVDALAQRSGWIGVLPGALPKLDRQHPLGGDNRAEPELRRAHRSVSFSSMRRCDGCRPLAGQGSIGWNSPKPAAGPAAAVACRWLIRYCPPPRWRPWAAGQVPVGRVRPAGGCRYGRRRGAPGDVWGIWVTSSRTVCDCRARCGPSASATRFRCRKNLGIAARSGRRRCGVGGCREYLAGRPKKSERNATIPARAGPDASSKLRGREARRESCLLLGHLERLFQRTEMAAQPAMLLVEHLDLRERRSETCFSASSVPPARRLCLRGRVAVR